MSYACITVPSGMRFPAGPPLRLDRQVTISDLFLRTQPQHSPSNGIYGKKLRYTRKAIGSSRSLSSLDSILEDEESEYNEDLDKDLAYAVQVDPTVLLGNEAALQALFAEDTDDEGIQGNFAIPGENGPTEGADGRINGTSAGSADNSLNKNNPPSTTTTLPADKSAAAPATALHRLQKVLPTPRAPSRSTRDAGCKPKQGISNGITSGQIAGKQEPRGATDASDATPIGHTDDKGTGSSPIPPKQDEK